MAGIRRHRVATLAANGAPPQAAVSLYPGTVMHQRLKPFGHRFTYSVFSLLIDVDRLDEADGTARLFSVDRPNFVSFRQSDHLEPGDTSLRARAERLLGAAGLRDRPHRILLLTFPRVAGYVFNPISVWYAFDDQERLTGVIYAVRNTFGERHDYAAPVRAGELSEAGLRQARAKQFHVSPFISMDSGYRFSLLPPGRVMRLRIHQSETGTPVLATTWQGRHRPLTSAALATLVLKIPFMTWKIIAGIHWEALKLWLKGARFYPHPGPARQTDPAGTDIKQGAAETPGH